MNNTDNLKMSDLSRKHLYKNANKDFESQRRQRQDHSIELRKNKKIENLQKRRNIQIDDSVDNSPSKENVVPEKPDAIKTICDKMADKSLDVVYSAVVECRKLLSQRNNPPIDQFCKYGAVKTLVSIMNKQDSDKMLFEAAWALTNIASGESEHTQTVVVHGGIELFKKFMSHNNETIAEQCIWALSNIVGDCPEYRDTTLKYDVVSDIKNCVDRCYYSNGEILRNLAWLISNLCRHKSNDYPVFEIKRLLPIISRLLKNDGGYHDVVMLADLVWGLSYAADGHESLIDAIIEAELLKVVIQFLNQSVDVAAPSLRLLGNIIAGSNEQTDKAIEVGVIEGMSQFLEICTQPRLIKECCWVLSNIAAGTNSQLKCLIDSGVLVKVLAVLKDGKDHKSQKEAAWVISNTSCNEMNEPKLYLLNHNVFEALVPMLSIDDATIVSMLLDCTRDLFTVAEKYDQLDQCVTLFEEAGGVDAVEKLQVHASEEIYHKSYKLVTDFLGVEDDDEVVDEPKQEMSSSGDQKFEF